MRYTIIFYLPSAEVRDTPYIGAKTAPRHDDFISHFPENVDFYVATHESEYQGNDSFLPKYKRTKGVWEIFQGNTIQADLILGMTARIQCTKKYINPIRDLCKDKREIEKALPHLTITSISCNTYKDIVENFDKISTPKKVLKPSHGSQAIGIIISEELPKKSDLEEQYPYLLQEFFDTSSGFGEHEGIHDLRTVIINGEISGSFLRIPPKGVLTANVKTGATIIDYGQKDLPSNVMQVIQEVDMYCAKKYPQRYYSIDIGVGKNNEVRIFELNSSPALSTPSIRKALAVHIIKSILKIR